MVVTGRDMGDVRVIEIGSARIDAAGAVQFKEAVQTQLRGHEGRVVMDLSAVGFLDSSGLGALVAVMKMLGGRPLELVGCAGPVRKVLTLTRMDRVFRLHDDVAAALARGRDAA